MSLLDQIETAYFDWESSGNAAPDSILMPDDIYWKFYQEVFSAFTTIGGKIKYRGLDLYRSRDIETIKVFKMEP